MFSLFDRSPDAISSRIYKMYNAPASEDGDQVTTEERKREIFAQPSAAKEVYLPKGHYVNGHIIVRGPDSLWHLFYEPFWV